MIILNLTQHPATWEQFAAGVVDVPADLKVELSNLLTFDTLPTCQAIEDRAAAIAALVGRIKLGEGIPCGDDRFDGLQDDGTAIKCMIGGAPYLMSALEAALLDDCRIPVYAFSQRVSVEEIQADGSVKKTNEFRHLGFVS